uniref:Si:dkey-42i9.7 n=1 Tax=Cyprinus carpio TaxID=7962 RepID=A0A8C1RV48_CYPCA
MASTSAVLLLLSAGLFTVTVGFGDCQGYFTSNNAYSSSISCGLGTHCCGSCDYRYCCSSESVRLSEHDLFFLNTIVCETQKLLFIHPHEIPNQNSVVQTHVTTVMNTQSIQQQPVMQGGQYPQYQPVPTQPGYGGHPMQTGPYQGQSYAPGPPPLYHVAMSPGYATIQGAYDGGQAMYPMQPPAQLGVAPMLSETSNQPAYNPAYMQPPKPNY